MMRPLLALLALAASIQPITADCDCDRELLQERVCRTYVNTVLFRGTVESVTVVGSNYHSIMKKVKVFKDVSDVIPRALLTSSTRKNKKVALETAISDASCGLDMAVGSEWLIDAYFYESEAMLGTGFCAINERWPSSKKYSKLLRKLLKKPDCSCEIRTCEVETADCQAPPPNVDECFYLPYIIDPRCDITYKRCRRIRGVCTWLSRPANCDT